VNIFCPAPAEVFVAGEADVIEPVLTDEIDGAIRKIRPDVSGDRLDRRPKFLFVLPNRLLGPLACVDLGSDSVPADDLTAGVAQRFDPDEEPSVLSVLSSYARLGLEQRARGKARTAQRDESIDVIGVDHLQRNVLAAQFLVRQAEVVESLLIRNNVAGVAIEYENVAGDRIDDRAKGFVVGF